MQYHAAMRAAVDRGQLHVGLGARRSGELASGPALPRRRRLAERHLGCQNGDRLVPMLGEQRRYRRRGELKVQSWAQSHRLDWEPDAPGRG